MCWDVLGCVLGCGMCWDMLGCVLGCVGMCSGIVCGWNCCSGLVNGWDCCSGGICTISVPDAFSFFVCVSCLGVTQSSKVPTTARFGFLTANPASPNSATTQNECSACLPWITRPIPNSF
jgi:hypothetical protein